MARVENRRWYGATGIPDIDIPGLRDPRLRKGKENKGWRQVALGFDH